MIWFGKSFIKFCKSFIDLIKLVSTRTCSSARVRSLLWSVKSSLGGEDWKTISCAGNCISSIFNNSRESCGQAFLLLLLWGYTIAIITPMLQASTCGQVWAFGPTANESQRKSDVHVCWNPVKARSPLIKIVIIWKHTGLCTDGLCSTQNGQPYPLDNKFIWTFQRQ